MIYKLKMSSTIPVVAFGNICPMIEMEGENYDELEKISLEKISNLGIKYGGIELKEKNPEANGFEKIETFTGETILYNKEEHNYLSLDGVRLLGGSTYAKKFETPFDKEKIIPVVAKKNNMTYELVERLWLDNGEMSKFFGTAIHKALENGFRYNKFTCYKTPKHPLLFNMLNTFPLKGEDATPEVMVSDVKTHRVGQIDLIVGTDRAKKQCYLVDYKSDAEIEKNLQKHFNQMSFYADILKVFGYDVSQVVVGNYTDKGTKYESKVLPIEGK